MTRNMKGVHIQDYRPFYNSNMGPRLLRGQSPRAVHAVADVGVFDSRCIYNRILLENGPLQDSAMSHQVMTLVLCIV